MKNILYLSSSGYTGGAEISLYHLVMDLNKDRYEPFVLCPHSGNLVDKFKTNQISTCIIPLPSWRKIKSLPFKYSCLDRVIRFAQSKSINLIHCNTIWVNHYACKTGKKLDIPVICHLRDLIAVEQVKKYSLDKINAVIAISDSVREVLIKSGIDNKRVYRIYNGVDLSLFKNLKRTLRREYSVSGYLVGIVGQMNPTSQWKGQREFLHAAAEILKSRSDVHFVLIGGDNTPVSSPEHGSYIKELKELSRQLNIDEKTIFTGFRKDIPNVMASLDILVSASWAEPFGRVIIEAMAAGCPVIATKAGGAPEIVCDNITGKLVPPKNPRAIANGVLEILQDAELMRNMSYAGQKRARDKFSIDKNVREIQKVYQHIFNS
ncbi:glycosyltransferase [Candidatus Poribacteria bacterium]|nr:glycosyltransferase [Candidatus Poribacteria bacterium]